MYPIPNCILLLMLTGTMALQLRPYQKRIVDSIGQSNAIIMMPTGSGKTFLAAELIRKNLNNGQGRAVLFVVPTQDLVDQQSQAIEKWCPDVTVLRFTGGMTDPRSWQPNEKVCLVSTPKAFLHLQSRKEDTFGWQAFGLVCFDEVHHVLKEHPFRQIALNIQNWISGHVIHILGLSASLTYQIGDEAIKKDLSRLQRELKLEKMESPTLDELIEGGYCPPHGRNVELENTTESPEGVVPLVDRKPHLLHKQFMDRIKNRQATPFSQLVWTVIARLEDRCRQAYAGFESPLVKSKLIRWEEYAYKLGKERPESEKELLRALECWYGALRLLAQSWEEEELLVLQWLKMNNAFEFVGSSSISEVGQLQTRADNPNNFFKFGRLRHHLLEKLEQKGGTFRCIVFVQQRMTAVILSHFINHDSQLLKLGIKSDFVTARDSTITPRIIVSKSQGEATIQSFRDNQINVLVATSVIEEVRNTKTYQCKVERIFLDTQLNHFLCTDFDVRALMCLQPM